PFILVASAFASYAFVPSGLSAHLLAIFARAGIDAGTVVWIGALFGPAQVGARLIEFTFGRNLHPLWVARFALSALLCAFGVLALLGVSTGTVAAFALMFGGANGLVTITRGAVPLALFGASGYGRLMGRLAGPFLLMQSAAPLIMAFAVEHTSDPAALALTAGCASLALICFIAIRRPKKAGIACTWLGLPGAPFAGPERAAVNRQKRLVRLHPHAQACHRPVRADEGRYTGLSVVVALRRCHRRRSRRLLPHRDRLRNRTSPQCRRYRTARRAPNCRARRSQRH